MDCLEMCYLILKYWGIVQISSSNWFLGYSVFKQKRKYDFYSLKFVEVGFAAQNIHMGECSTYT